MDVRRIRESMGIMNELLEKYYSARKEHDRILAKLDVEVSRIVTVITKCFFIKPGRITWSYDYYDDSENNPPLPQLLQDNGKTFPCFVDDEMATSVQDYSIGFPLSFFDMSNREIKNYVMRELDKDEAEETAEEEKRMKRELAIKLKKEKLKKSAAGKLTAEERKVLGL